MKYNGIDKDNHTTIYSPKRCDCFCGIGGSCSHRWDAESTYETGNFRTVKCYRCGITAAKHDQLLEPMNVATINVEKFEYQPSANRNS